MKNVFPLLILFFLISCSKDSPTPTTNNFECTTSNPATKGNRTIGIDLLNLTETNSFDDNIRLAKELGIEFIALHMIWSGIESSPENYTDPNNAIQLLGEVAENNNMKFSLTLRPIDLTGKTVPSDLENMRFNDPIIIDRFKRLLDFVFTKINPKILLNLQIGNEIDGYDSSNEHVDFWSDYGAFLFSIQQYVHSINPNVKVGFTATYDGLMANQTVFTSLINAVDLLGVTYYPLQSNFDVEEPDVIFQDLDNLISSYNTVPIYLQEVGYQTSAVNNSSEDKQAEFYCNFFKAWDTHKEDIIAANIVRLNDLSTATAELSAGDYNIDDRSFIEYLRTLGVRSFSNEGQNKPAYQIIKDNLRQRAW